MLQGGTIVLAALLYLSLLFAIAYYVDKRAEQGRNLVNNPTIYALSIAVYCTSWTFYGSVGHAASVGIDFLPVYLGPTLVFVAWWFVLRKIIRIAKAHRITSIADFISSRYGKSARLSGFVTVIAVLGIIPYISLQLKAVSNSFHVLLEYPDIVMPPPVSERVFLIGDTTFLVALLLAVFSILFGTRHIDASEHHEGMVAAIAFESIVKLAAFLAVGLFVTFGLYDGFGDLFSRAAVAGETSHLLSFAEGGSYGSWVTVTILSMAAIICLPRQFQVTAVENVDERHLETAAWLFPLYLLLINIFVLPIALGGLLLFPGGGVDGDTFVLTIPMAQGQETLALFAFLGGLSAATGMVIVATVALSTMLCNDLVMPGLLRLGGLREADRGDLTGLLLAIRRASIVVILLLGYAYFRFLGGEETLVSIGLVSFAAAAQFAPAMIIGMYWKGGSAKGAFAGLVVGFLFWSYTLVLPLFARSGFLPLDFTSAGPLAIEWLRPHALFGLEGMDNLSHALFWSLFGNIACYVLVSIWSSQSAIERIQAVLFVDVNRWASTAPGTHFWRGSATVADLYAMVSRFTGPQRATEAFAAFAARRQIDLAKQREADADLVSFAERLLAGAIGAASARVMVATVAKGEVMGIEEVMAILEEASQVIEYSQTLEQKSSELEATTAELRAANARLQELDRLKDDFLSTVSHELRTPLTSIRSFSEILADNPSLSGPERSRFLGVIVRESERLTRLINQILDLAKLDAGSMEWHLERLEPGQVIREALEAASGLFPEGEIGLEVEIEEGLAPVQADRDRLIQVIVNLLSNAAKFCRRPGGQVRVTAKRRGGDLLVAVSDNGPGIAPQNREIVFDRFRQAETVAGDKPQGTGLGLAISRQIIEFFGGRIWVAREGDATLPRPGESEPEGARIAFVVPGLVGGETAIGQVARSAQ